MGVVHSYTHHNSQHGTSTAHTSSSLTWSKIHTCSTTHNNDKCGYYGLTCSLQTSLKFHTVPPFVTLAIILLVNGTCRWKNTQATKPPVYKQYFAYHLIAFVTKALYQWLKIPAPSATKRWLTQITRRIPGNILRKWTALQTAHGSGTSVGNCENKRWF